MAHFATPYLLGLRLRGADITADAYAAATTVTARTYLPNVTRTLGGPTGWTTPIILQSVTATTATLKWYRFDTGQLATRKTSPSQQARRNGSIP